MGINKRKLRETKHRILQIRDSAAPSEAPDVCNFISHCEVSVFSKPFFRKKLDYREYLMRGGMAPVKILERI
jgi:hypothetical protein